MADESNKTPTEDRETESVTTDRPESGTPSASSESASAPPDSSDADGSTPVPEPEGNSEPEIKPKAAKPRAGVKAFIAALFWIVVLIGGVGAGGYAAWPLWKPYAGQLVNQIQSDPFSDPRMVELTGNVKELNRLAETIARLEKDRDQALQTVTELRERVARMETALTELQKNAPTVESRLDVAAPAAVVEELNRRVGQLEAAIDTNRIAAKESVNRVTSEQTHLTSQVERMQERLQTVESVQKKRENAGLESRLKVIAISQLAAVLSSNAPYEEPLRTLKSLANDDSDIAALAESLAPYADTGIPTIAQLQKDYETVAREAVQAQVELEGDGWVDKTLNRLIALVSVRTVGDGEAGDPVDAAVAAAESRLDAGDLEGAIKALETIEGAAKSKVSDWLATAKARLAAERAMTRLNARATSALGEIEG